jgi:hypothetical protein
MAMLDAQAMETPDFRYETISKIEFEPAGRGCWYVVLVRSRGAVLCGTTRYPARNVEEALAIAKVWMSAG